LSARPPSSPLFPYTTSSDLPFVAVEIGQDIGDRAPQPGAPRRRDHPVLVVGQRGEDVVVVVREHGDLVRRGGLVALEQQVLKRRSEEDTSERQSLTTILCPL